MEIKDSSSGPSGCFEGACFARLDEHTLRCIANKLRPIDLHAFSLTCRTASTVTASTVHRLRTGRRSTIRRGPETVILQGQHNLSARFPFLSHLDVWLVDNLDLSSLSCLKHLASLLLYVTGKSSPKPEPVDRLQDLTCLRGLEKLALEADFLQRLQLDALWQLTWLRSLRFQGFRLWEKTNISGLMRGISCLAHLQELALPGVSSISLLHPVLPEGLPARLSYLEFHIPPDRRKLCSPCPSGEGDQSADYKQLSRLAALRELVVWDFSQQGYLLSTLTSLSSLSRLALHNCMTCYGAICTCAICNIATQDTSLIHLSKLLSLRALHLDLYVTFTDEGLDRLCSISSLQSLQFGMLYVWHLSALSKLSGLNLLTSLSIASGLEEIAFPGDLTPDALHFLTGLSVLRHLKLSRCFEWRMLMPICLSSIVHATQLDSLYLSGCDGLINVCQDTDYIRVLTRLTHLSLRYCRHLATGLLPVVTELPNLQDLDISFCEFENSSKLSGQALSHLVGLTDLRKISLAVNSWVGDDELLILELCAGLEVVDVEDCKVTRSGLQRLSERMRLRELRVSSYHVRKEDIALLRGPLGCCRVYLDGKYAHPDNC